MTTGFALLLTWAALPVFSGCLAETQLGGFDATGWRVKYKSVYGRLRSLHDSGHRIVIISNEVRKMG